MELLEIYKGRIDLYKNLESTINSLVRTLLSKEKIQYHQITTRVKTTSSLKKKIIDKNYKYDDLNQITDIVGLRIITYYEDEVDIIADVISKEFEIDLENSIDKRQKELDRFGYKSLHYICKFDKGRLGNREYSDYADIPFEIQIRTILQHSWAEIEHDIGYKGERQIPDFLRRDFYRIAALLESADIGFQSIKEKLSEYQAKVESLSYESLTQEELNLVTLTKYMEESNLVQRINETISKEMQVPIGDGVGNLDHVLEIFDKYGLNNIQALKETLTAYQNLIINFTVRLYKRENANYHSLGKYLAIHSLALIKILENSDKSTANYYSDSVLSFQDQEKMLKEVKASNKDL